MLGQAKPGYVILGLINSGYFKLWQDRLRYDR